MSILLLQKNNSAKVKYAGLILGCDTMCVLRTNILNLLADTKFQNSKTTCQI